MDDLLNEFLTETSESIAELDQELVKLEQNPNDAEILGNIFRLVHTIKGTCGFLGLPRLEAVAHAAENVLGKIRDGELEVTVEIITLVLEALDQIKSLVATLEATEAEPEGDDTDLIARLNALVDGSRAAPAAPVEVKPAAPAEVKEVVADDPPEPSPAPGTGTDGRSIFERVGGASAVDAAIEVMYRKALKDADLAPFFEGVNLDLLQGRQVEFVSMALGGPDNYGGGDLGSAHSALVARGLNDSHFDKVATYLSEALSELGVGDDLIAEILAVVETTRGAILNRDAAQANEPPPEEAAPRAVEQQAPPPPEPAPESAPESVAEPGTDVAAPPAAAGAAKEPSRATQSIRVNVNLLENLMTMVSELVLTRNQLLQMIRGQDDSDFAVPLQRLSHVTTELQEGVMKTRMQPIGNAWGKLPRIVRDLALELDRKVDLQMRGADTELDRQVLELIKDPLTHMVRNSADHGIESVDERRAAGKPETGVITLDAYHEGGHIIVEITDDGRGIAIEKVKAKIVENGMASDADLAGMSDQQIYQFIFKPGFSTATKVTNVSGRGVGMDVVRTNIEKIGGTIELQSAAGKGSTVTIKIPLTLAIVSALIVECSGERFAVPQINVVELVRATEGSEHNIERINDTPVLRLRNRLLPLVSLSDLLQLRAPDSETPADMPEPIAAETTAAETIVEGAEGETETAASESGGGNSTDAFIIVSQVGTFKFGIMVDRVFDTEEIVVKPMAPLLRDIPIFSGNTILGDGSVIMILDPNGIATASNDTVLNDEQDIEGATTQDSGDDDRVALLIFRAGAAEPKAVPLALVARLEEIEIDKVEQCDTKPLIQYRGRLMPLVFIEGSAGFGERQSGRQPILVFAECDRAMGLVVDEIVDIVEENLDIELSSDRAGLMGSAIIAGKATEIVDAAYYLTQAFPDWFQNAAASTSESTGGRRLLLVDDSPFFRNLLTPLLSVAGYDVTTVESGGEALELRDLGKGFDVIVSDIEMPGMDGFAFAEAVRADGGWRETPIVALSSRSGADEIERGKKAGFNDYVVKLDRNALLNTLEQTLVPAQVADRTRGAA